MIIDELKDQPFSAGGLRAISEQLHFLITALEFLRIDFNFLIGTMKTKRPYNKKLALALSSFSVIASKLKLPLNICCIF